LKKVFSIPWKTHDRAGCTTSAGADADILKEKLGESNDLDCKNETEILSTLLIS
jgi:hypothetical protein